MSRNDASRNLEEVGAEATFVVLGPFRSGTSLVCQILSELGAEFGPAHGMERANRGNPGGYYQRRDVVAANEAIMRARSVDVELRRAPGQVDESIESRILQRPHLAWTRGVARAGLKDPRFCVTLDAWLREGVLARERTRIVMVDRDTDAVAASIAKHRTVGQYCDYDLDRAQRMADLYKKFAADQVGAIGVECFRVSYEGLISERGTSVERLAEHVGEVPASAVRRAKRRIGRRRALIRYYYGKACDPRQVLTDVKKTIGLAR